MKNLRISRQLILLVASLIVAFAAVTAFEIRKAADAIYAERYAMLRTQVQSAISVLKAFHEKEKANLLTREEAQRQAYDTVLAMRFDPDGYFFGYDYDVKMLFHPDPKRVGESFKGRADSQGYAYRDELVRLARAGGGQTDFYGPKPGHEGNDFLKSSYAMAYEPWSVVVVTGVYIDDLQAQVRKTILTALSVGLVVAGLGIALAIYIIRSISKPLNAIHRALEEVADDNVDIAIPHGDLTNEVGMMAKATVELQEKVRQRIRLEREAEANRSLSERERIEREKQKEQEAAELEFASRNLATGLARLAEGDVSYRIREAFAAHLEGTRRNFNDTAEKLDAALTQVAENARGIEAGSNEIRSAADDLARRTEQQAAAVEETAAALEEITTTVRDSTRRAQEAGQLVGRAKAGAEQSGEVVRRAVSAMEQIEKSSNEINSIIGVIDEIAFQTNLLALNAGVEAARAGEAGKGFAVVAQEVRELAQRSASAAKEIKTLITASNGQVREGVQLVGDTGRALETIVSDVQEINRHVGAIVEAAQEQFSGLQQINTAVNQMDQDTQKNAAMVEETTAATHSLSREVTSLNELLTMFRLSGSRLSGGAGQAPAPARPATDTEKPVASPVAALGRKIAGAFSGNAAVRKHDWEEF